MLYAQLLPRLQEVQHLLSIYLQCHQQWRVRHRQPSPLAVVLQQRQRQQRQRLQQLQQHLRI